MSLNICQGKENFSCLFVVLTEVQLVVPLSTQFDHAKFEFFVNTFRTLKLSCVPVCSF